jgi:hypothetical protein
MFNARLPLALIGADHVQQRFQLAGTGAWYCRAVYLHLPCLGLPLPLTREFKIHTQGASLTGCSFPRKAFDINGNTVTGVSTNITLND